MAGGRAPSFLSWGRRSRSWTQSSTCTWWPGCRHWLDLSNRCRSGDFSNVCLFLFASILKSLHLTSTHCSQTGTQGSSISSCCQGVDQRERSHEVMEILWQSIYWSCRTDLTSSWPYKCVFTAGHRRRTSSTASSGVSSGLTTTPPTSHADSRALLTSTWPPSAACSTTTSSTPFSLAALPYSTSHLSGLNTVLLVLTSPHSSTGPKQSPIRERERDWHWVISICWLKPNFFCSSSEICHF